MTDPLQALVQGYLDGTLDESGMAGLEDRLRSDPEALPRAIEESLRLAPPVMFIPRGCVRDTEVDETTVHDGQRVVMGTACAGATRLT